MNVVVLGGGYAGVTVTRRLEQSLPGEVGVTLVSDSPDHLIQHEVHRVIRRPAFGEQLTIPLESVVDRASIRQARVVDIDPRGQVVELETGRVAYDFCAVCLGASVDYHGLPGVAEHAVSLKRVEDALTIREGFLDAVKSGGRVIVGGAGLSGVQVAGELAAVASAESVSDTVDIVILEQCSSVAPGFPRRFQRAIHDELVDQGVVVRTDRAVSGVRDGVIELEDEEVGFDQLVWTGGIRGTDAMGGERPEVRGTLRASDSLFVVGDAATVVDRNGLIVPASAQSAIAEAKTAAANITKLVEFAREGGVFEPRLEVCEFEPPGWIVSVGDGAVAQVGPTVMRGAAAMALKSSVGVGYLSSVGQVRQAVEYARNEFTTGV